MAREFERRQPQPPLTLPTLGKVLGNFVEQDEDSKAQEILPTPEKLTTKQRLKEKLKRKFFHRKQIIVEKIVEGLGIFGAPDIRVGGKENLEKALELTKGKNLAFVMNHTSNFDTPALERSLKKIGFGEIVPKLIYLQGIKLDKNPVAKIFLGGFNRIRVWPPNLPAENETEKIERKKMTRESLESAKRALGEGYFLGIYCEGGRSYNGKLKEVEPAAIHYLTMQPDTIVIPVAIRETDKVLPRGSFIIFPAAPVNVNFGEPIIISFLLQEYQNLPNDEKHKKIGDFIMGKIAKQLPEEYRGVYV
ncbi:MAG: hypothetical protein A3B47_03430 [Candidatus Levybacteria bacterium RIFCSPLOWO2_01_FULL_39_24]|nr:MAG: hypothetical protein A2800_02720 [Candidatus Levybacteria bacterium RIFCSPHIGHO2_01_FULL_40_16]OGH28236.1 MAG: hypothetical protein A3E12_00690 [Candidatus Levybacteria bacterium RIFCSPHIGHO2_12_FULL_39_9]OGH46671.1 MAG: hypothetical protein A3B47_03430 [Candidatus Levybacteria bacterium RIFCSPLOWO2_01_FULL_39_24]